MRSRTLLFLALPILLGGLLLNAAIIRETTPQTCEMTVLKVADIAAGSSGDIVFSDSEKNFYYINRGLEKGLTVAELKEEVLNKKVTLHLARVFYGTTAHIAQLKVGDQIIYTEFE